MEGEAVKKNPKLSPAQSTILDRLVSGSYAIWEMRTMWSDYTGKFLGLLSARWRRNGVVTGERAVNSDSLDVLKRHGLIRRCERHWKTQYGMRGYYFYVPTAAGRRLHKELISQVTK